MFNGHLVEKIGTAPKQNLTESNFEISTSNLEHNILDFCFLISSSIRVQHVL